MTTLSPALEFAIELINRPSVYTTMPVASNCLRERLAPLDFMIEPLPFGGT